MSIRAVRVSATSKYIANLGLDVTRPFNRKLQFLYTAKRYLSTTEKVIDKRYEPKNPVPSRVLESMHSDQIHSPGFSIKGKFNHLLVH